MNQVIPNYFVLLKLELKQSEQQYLSLSKIHQLMKLRNQMKIKR